MTKYDHLKDQLLDVTIIVAFVADKDDCDGQDKDCYPATNIFRLDVEGDHFEEFIEGIHNLSGLVHMDKVKAEA